LSKLTKLQREELKSLVVDASIRRLSEKETSAYIFDKLGVSISIDHISHLKTHLKRDGVRELQSLQKDRDYYLQRMFWDRLAELEYQQKVLHGIIDRNEHNSDAQIKAVHELRGITEDMAQLFINLPAASTMSIPIPFDSNMKQRLEPEQKKPDWYYPENDKEPVL
jgi:hypothetical protein